jgi:outer membrane protein assembly factor BamD (BamD/ComL family)
MKGGDWAGAAHAYRQIRTHYPTRPESRTILITLGQLELDRLGQPGQALTTFQTYLREDGALSREARLGQIRALARLGRAPEETSAIEAYLTSYPRSTEASRLRTRLRALSTQ